MLQAERNIYGGMMIDPALLPEEDEALLRELDHSLTLWQAGDASLAWLTLPASRHALLSPLLVRGFEFHNCTREEVTLVKRIKPRAFVPSTASHYVGAGGVVINDKNQLLVITEKAHTVKHYKLPGGLLDVGEDLTAGVAREVWEETGIKAEFESVACFRHTHGYQFGKSDFYFVCRLRPLSEEITADPGEIHEALWMDVDEYLASPDTHIFNRTIVEAALQGSPFYKSEGVNYSFHLKELEVFLPSREINRSYRP
ncbi:MAG: NUDIX domain-containing protein [Spirochaetales bacterium]|nr:NUDIX domain-containing protein [Spirochaetales bacterium]